MPVQTSAPDPACSGCFRRGFMLCEIAVASGWIAICRRCHDQGSLFHPHLRAEPEEETLAERRRRQIEQRDTRRGRTSSLRVGAETNEESDA